MSKCQRQIDTCNYFTQHINEVCLSTKNSDGKQIGVILINLNFEIEPNSRSQLIGNYYVIDNVMHIWRGWNRI